MSRHVLRIAISCVVTLAAIAPVVSRAEWVANGNTYTQWEGMLPSVISDGGSGIFAAARGTAVVKLSHWSDAGEVLPGWPVQGLSRSVDVPNGGEFFPAIAADGDGGCYCTWFLSGPGCDAECGYDPGPLLVQRLGPGGRPARDWPSGGVRVIAPELGYPYFGPRIVSDGRRGAVIAWFYKGGIYPEIHAGENIILQAIGPDATRRWGPYGLSLLPDGESPSPPVLVADGSGGVIVAWAADWNGATHRRVMAQHVSAAGRLLWRRGGICLSAGADSLDRLVPGALAIACDHEGGAIVAFSRPRGRDVRIFAVRVDSRGSLPWRDDVPVCTAAGGRDEMCVAASEAGGVVVAWRDARHAADAEVFVQKLTPRGRALWGRDGVRVCGAGGSRGLVVIAPDGEGAFVAWGDTRVEAELCATRLNAAGRVVHGWREDGEPVCAQIPYGGVGGLSLAALPHHRAMVAWQDWRGVPGQPGLPLEGSALMLLTPSGPAASPVVASSRPQLPAVPDASASPPASGPTFALRGVRPNPATSGATIAFALPDASPATLELFDIAGRRVWSRDVGALGAGEHVVRVCDGEGSPPGLYLVRLRQGERVASQRVVVVN